MSGGKFTAGPWRFESLNDKRHHYHAIMADKGGKDGEGGLLATVNFGFGTHFTDSEAAANAHLIAAAPDYDAAARDIVGASESILDEGDGEVRFYAITVEQMDALRAAIARASCDAT